MAKLDGVIQFTGKLGQTVGAKGQDGRNVLRVRRNSIKNPKTDAQCAQRMICTTAAQAVSQLKQILNNGFEGKSFGAKSLQHARSLYMRMLRTTPSLDGNGMVYLPKGSLNFPINRYPLSEGSLQGGGFVFDQDGDAFTFESNIPEGGLAAATASQLFSRVVVGHQITMVAAGVNEMGKAIASVLRFAFKDNATPALVSVDGEFRLNPAAINVSLAEGNFPYVAFTSQDSGITRMSIPVDFDIKAAAIIISDKVGGKRSTAFLEVKESATLAERGGLSAAEAMPTYGDNAASLNLPSDYYLQNSLTPESAE